MLLLFYDFVFKFFVYFLFNSEKKQSHNKECVDGEEMKPLNELKKGLNFILFLILLFIIY